MLRLIGDTAFPRWVALADGADNSGDPDPRDREFIEPICYNQASTYRIRGHLR